MLQRDPTINIFFGRADALALGAAQAAKASGGDHKIYVFGFDGDLAGLKAVKDGTLDATMTQRTQFMGKLALQSALDLMGARNLRRLPVLDANGVMVGLVTLSDLSRRMLLDSGVIQQAVREIGGDPA